MSPITTVSITKLIKAKWRVYVSVNSTIIDTDNGFAPNRHQGIIWNNADFFLIGPLRKNFNQISIKIQTISFKKFHFRMDYYNIKDYFMYIEYFKSFCAIIS